MAVNGTGQLTRVNPMSPAIKRFAQRLDEYNATQNKKKKEEPKPKLTPKQKRQRQRRRETRKWLANDSAFQHQRSAIKAERDRYLEDYRRQKSRARGDFGTAKGRLAEQRLRSISEQNEQLAARGIDTSTVALQDRNKLDQTFADQETDLLRDRDRVLEDLLSNRQAFGSGLRNERINARQEALRRRVQQMGTRYR